MVRCAWLQTSARADAGSIERWNGGHKNKKWRNKGLDVINHE